MQEGSKKATLKSNIEYSLGLFTPKEILDIVYTVFSEQEEVHEKAIQRYKKAIEHLGLLD
jgi:hypothetical protein